MRTVSMVGGAALATILGLLAQPLGAEWADGERKTVAYASLPFETFEWGEWLQRHEEGPGADPFAEDADAGFNPRRARDLIRRLDAAPAPCRFFREGDALWDVGAQLERLGVIAGDASWAVLNTSTRRLIVHGARDVHRRLIPYVRSSQARVPRLVTVRCRLLKVRARELGGVEWTAPLVGRRMVEELATSAVTTRPGQRAEVELKRNGWAQHMEAEPNVGADDDVVDLRLAYEAGADGDVVPAEVWVNTGLTVREGTEFFMDIGMLDDAAHTLVLGVSATIHFMGGTPVSRWREFEDPGDQPDPDAEHAWHDPERIVLEDGKRLGIWQVPPTFLDDIDTDGAEVDPFADDLPGKAEARRNGHRYPAVERPAELEAWVGNEVLVDVGDPIREFGIVVPDGCWVLYARHGSRLFAKLDADNMDLLEALLEPL